EGYLQYLPGVNDTGTNGVQGGILLVRSASFSPASPLSNLRVGGLGVNQGRSVSADVSINGGPIGSNDVIFGGASLVDAQSGFVASVPVVEQVGEIRV